MVAKGLDAQLLRDLDHTRELEQALADRLRKVLLALILTRETEALLQRRLDVLEQHTNGRLRSAQSAELAAQRCRDVLTSIASSGDEADGSSYAGPPHGPS